MAHTTFTLCVEGVQDTSKIENQLRSIADESGLQFDVDTVLPRFKVQVRTDQDPQNPRTDFDNVGVMFCKHGRYTLGDEHADDPFEEVTIYDLGGYEIEEPALNEVAEMLREWLHRAYVERGSDSEEYAFAQEAYDFANGTSKTPYADEWTGKRLRGDVAIILPIYAYEHGGITISHGSFSCQWDSGQLGWHYVTKEALESEWDGDEEEAKKCLEVELEIYDSYLQGNVWGFTIEDEEGDDIGSCWGFYGDDFEGMKHHVEYRFHKALEEAWEHRYSGTPVFCDSEGNIVEEDE